MIHCGVGILMALELETWNGVWGDSTYEGHFFRLEFRTFYLRATQPTIVEKGCSVPTI